MHENGECSNLRAGEIQVIRKILIPVEDELFVDAIADFVENLNSPSNDLTLRIMHADIPPESLTAWTKGDSELEPMRLVDSVRSALKKRIPDQSIETVVVDGTPKNAILDEARAWNADLILLGPHGQRGISKFILGSVAASVIPDAPCSVVMLKPLFQEKEKLDVKEVEKQGAA